MTVFVKPYKSSALESLSASLLNNTRNADIEVLFFNRAAKVGSESLLELFISLLEFNYYILLEMGGVNEIYSHREPVTVQYELAKNISALDDGTIWIQHVNWIDFENFKLPKPIYINLVRDPVERVISWYFYNRSAYKSAIEYKNSPNKPLKPEAWYKKDFNNCVRTGDPECQYIPFTMQEKVPDFRRQSMFYCGHHEDCLLNNTRKADIEVIFFNRCAKVGSEALLELFGFLEAYNDDLTLERDGLHAPSKRQFKRNEQRELAQKISELEDGSIWIEHVNWIDFEEFDLAKPIFINMVRDPVERVISWYYYARGAYKNAIEYRKDPEKPPKPESWYKKDFNKCVRSGDPECQYVPFSVKDYVGNFKRQSLFFCGHHDDCLPFNSPAAIQMAKEHVERDYAVVGTWEETNITLTVFEKYIPRFFNGAKLLFELNYEKITSRNKNKRKPKIDDDVKAMIRKNFTHEYDFYYFCKQRLFKQYLAINLKQLEQLNKL